MPGANRRVDEAVEAVEDAPSKPSPVPEDFCFKCKFRHVMTSLHTHETTRLAAQMKIVDDEKRHLDRVQRSIDAGSFDCDDVQESLGAHAPDQPLEKAMIEYDRAEAAYQAEMQQARQVRREQERHQQEVERVERRNRENLEDRGDDEDEVDEADGIVNGKIPY
jgi:hypothetical protein